MKPDVRMPWQSRRAVILGGTGFIGLNLAHALAGNGKDVVVFARNPSARLPASAKLILGDIANPPPALLEAMRGAVIFHLASTTRPANSTSGANAELLDNAGSTVSLLEATAGFNCRWVFVSSGGTVYGPPTTERLAETHPTQPISSYGIVKLAIERYFGLFRNFHDTEYGIARISNPYGPHQAAGTGQGLIANLLDRIARGETVEVWGDGLNIRDYIFVEDAIRALLRLAEFSGSGEIYNIGSGHGASILDLIDRVSAVVGRPAQIVHLPARNVDIRRNILDISKITREIGWHPEIGLDEGIARTWSWLTRTENPDKM